MKLFILLLAVTLLVQKDSLASASDYKASGGHTQQAAAGEQNSKDLTASSPLIGALSRSNRKSRCVRCYDDRYDMYEPDRYGGGYSSRRGYDDDRSYYMGRGGGGGGAADYDRYGGYGGGYGGGSSYGGGGAGYGGGSSYYRDRDDRYSPRSYYDEGRRGYDAGRYSDRGGVDSRYNYEGNYRDRYTGGDRYYDRSRQTYGGAGDYDRGAYDRGSYDRGSYPRYDYRNYRPFDETYRGQSGFDNSGRGYYFAGDSQNEAPKPQTRCSTQVLNCPYGGTGSGTRVTSRPLQHSDIPLVNAPGLGYGPNGHNSDNSHNNNNNDKNNNQSSNGWRHIKENEQEEKQSMPRERERERDVQQSSSYGGRQQRPLGGSYLFDRDSSNVAGGGGGTSAAGGNTLVESKTSGPNNNNNLVSSQGQMPNAQAQTADGSPQTPKPLGDMADNNNKTS